MPACVSVIIATYRAEETIARAVSSALLDDDVLDVIVVDDASGNDLSIEAAKQADDGTGRLQIFTLEHNQGPAAARNFAITKCQGEWITILDSDDYVEAGRLSAMLAFADNYDIIADDLYQVDALDETQQRTTLLQPPCTENTEVSLSEFILSNIAKGQRTRGELGFIKPLIRRAFIEQHKISYQEHMRLGEDYELYARILAHGGTMILVPAQGYISIRHAGSLSGQHGIADLKNLRDCNLKLLADFKLKESTQKAMRLHYREINCRYQWRLLIEAVKHKNVIGCFKCFIDSPLVSLYLMRQLLEQIIVRTCHKPE